MQNPNTIPAQVVVNGGLEMSVRLASGDVEVVTVRLVPMSQASKYLELIGDIAKFVEFVCKKPEGWADTLDLDSLFLVDAKAKELNDPRIDRLLQRQRETVERLVPAAKQAQQVRADAGLTS